MRSRSHPLRRLTIGVVFLLLAMAAFFGVVQGFTTPMRMATSWCCTCLFFVGIAYLANWTDIYGKSPQGRLDLSRVVPMAPWLLFTWGVWRLQLLVSESQPWSKVTPHLFVGRRCSAHELPPGTTFVVDVTAEFPTPASVRKSVRFMCGPTLDGCAPPWTTCQSVLTNIPWDQNPIVYFCCANGSGRSVTWLVVVMGLLGLAESPEEAISRIQAVRPSANPGRDQRAFLRAVYALRS